MDGMPPDWALPLASAAAVVVLIVLARVLGKPVPPSQIEMSSSPDRFELHRPSGTLVLLGNVDVVFDRNSGRVLNGNREICNLGAVVEVEVYGRGESALLLVFMNSDNNEQRWTFAKASSWREASETKDRLNEWLRTYNH